MTQQPLNGEGSSAGADKVYPFSQREAKVVNYVWTSEATKRLIQLRTETDLDFQNSKQKKCELWEDISQALEDEGYLFPSNICDKKWRNLLVTFRRVQTRGTNGRISRSPYVWEYYKELLAFSESQSQKDCWVNYDENLDSNMTDSNSGFEYQEEDADEAEVKLENLKAMRQGPLVTMNTDGTVEVIHTSEDEDTEEEEERNVMAETETEEEEEFDVVGGVENEIHLDVIIGGAENGIEEESGVENGEQEELGTQNGLGVGLGTENTEEEEPIDVGGAESDLVLGGDVHNNDSIDEEGTNHDGSLIDGDVVEVILAEDVEEGLVGLGGVNQENRDTPSDSTPQYGPPRNIQMNYLSHLMIRNREFNLEDEMRSREKKRKRIDDDEDEVQEFLVEEDDDLDQQGEEFGSVDVGDADGECNGEGMSTQDPGPSRKRQHVDNQCYEEIYPDLDPTIDPYYRSFTMNELYKKMKLENMFHQTNHNTSMRFFTVTAETQRAYAHELELKKFESLQEYRQKKLEILTAKEERKRLRDEKLVEMKQKKLELKEQELKLRADEGIAKRNLGQDRKELKKKSNDLNQDLHGTLVRIFDLQVGQGAPPH